MVAIKISKKSITLPLQRIYLLKKYSEVIEKTNIKNGCLKVTLNIKPSDFSVSYKVLIEYKLKMRPNVYVLSPSLEKRNGSTPPHIFNFNQGKICLHMSYDWSSKDELTDIIPWIYEWLLFYEIWLITGKWQGRGHSFEKGVNNENK